jgi:hypothetical protein
VSDEAELLMAVYARFGLAMHSCAMIEWDVLALVTAVRMRDGRAIDLADVTAVLEGAWKDVVDRLVDAVTDDVGAPAGMRRDLQDAFEIRRRLGTGWFRQRAQEMLSEEGRVDVLKDLNAAFATLQRVHERTGGVLKALVDKHALPLAQVHAVLRRTMGIDPEPTATS